MRNQTTKLFMVFINPTFSDLIEEQNALQANVSKHN